MIVTLADYKTALKIENSTEDAKISQYALEIEQRVKSYLGFDIEKTEYEELYNGNGTERLFPNNIPVTSISKIEVYNGLDGNGVEVWEEWTQNEHYQRLIIQGAGYMIYVDGTIFPEGNQNIRLTYKAGYTAETLPQDIQSVLKKLMVLVYQEIDKGNLGFTSINSAAGFTASNTLDTEASQRILKEIEHYKLVRV